MSKQLSILSALMLLLWVITGCTTASKLSKLGDSERQLGNMDEASTYYYNALLRKPGYQPAMEGLTQSAQAVLNEKFTHFNKLVVDNNIDEAMKVYKNAEKYLGTAASVGVQLRWPSEYNEVYADIRAEYISKLYDEALVLMNSNRYEQAEQTFDKIAALDSTYKGITVLRINTILEPLYQHGLIEMSQSKYRQAFQTFSKIVKQDETYKDAKLLRDEANAKATATIGILPISYKVQDSLLQRSDFVTMIQTRLSQKSLSYVQIRNTEEIARTMESRGWGVIDDVSKAIEAGKILGLKYIVLVEVKDIQYAEGKPVNEKKSAYEAFSENIPNPYTGTYSAITRFRKVEFDDIFERRTYRIGVRYWLIQVAEGKVIVDDEKEHEQKDEVHQYVYSGNINGLYEELPTGNFLPPPNQAWRDLFTGSKREPLTEQQLASEALVHLANQIAKSVNSYFK